MNDFLLSDKEIKEEANIVRRALINQIRQTSDRYSISYQVLSDTCNLKYQMRYPPDRKNFGRILGFLLREEHNAKRPLLTSIIYLAGQYIQGQGFFKLLHAENIRNARRHKLEKLKAIKFRRSLEKEAVVFWRDDSNYKRFKTKLNLA